MYNNNSTHIKEMNFHALNLEQAKFKKTTSPKQLCYFEYFLNTNSKYFLSILKGQTLLWLHKTQN